jgi:hypothetical protein
MSDSGENFLTTKSATTNSNSESLASPLDEGIFIDTQATLLPSFLYLSDKVRAISLTDKKVSSFVPFPGKLGSYSKTYNNKQAICKQLEIIISSQEKNPFMSMTTHL